MPITPVIRKAAILVSCLGRKEADALLESMPEAMARQVREAIVDLEEVDVDERDEVIREFVHRGGRAPSKDQDGVELAGSLASHLDLDAPRAYAAQPTVQKDHRPPFEFLHQADAERVAKFLTSERPQTVALVLSYLPTVQSARVAGALPESLQSDVLARLSDLDEADPEILAEVEQALRTRMERDEQSRARRTAGQEIVARILDAGGPKLANTWRAALEEPPVAITAETKPSNASEAPLRMLTWAEFERFEPRRAVEAVLATPPETSVLALAGATPGFFARLTSAMHPADAEFYRRATSRLSPTRLSDIDAAQRQLAAGAGEYALALPLSAPLAKAA